MERECWNYYLHQDIVYARLHFLGALSAVVYDPFFVLIFQSVGGRPRSFDAKRTKCNCNWKTENNFFERNSINQLYYYCRPSNTLAYLKLGRYPVDDDDDVTPCWVEQVEINIMQRSEDGEVRRLVYNAMCCSHGCVILLPYPSMAISIFLIIITTVPVPPQEDDELIIQSKGS